MIGESFCHISIYSQECHYAIPGFYFILTEKYLYSHIAFYAYGRIILCRLLSFINYNSILCTIREVSLIFLYHRPRVDTVRLHPLPSLR